MAWGTYAARKLFVEGHSDPPPLSGPTLMHIFREGEGQHMPYKRHKPEEIVTKLRQVDVLVAQGKTVTDAIRRSA